eukprot:g7359.t1
MDGVSNDVEENHPLLGDPEPSQRAGYEARSGAQDDTRYARRNRCCHPRHCSFRFLVALTASIMCFGPQIAYDSIGAAGPFLRKTMHIHAEQIGDLYSAYHFPNIVMVVVGGIFADRVGTSMAAILFSLFVCVGTAIVAMSSSFSMMLFGRLIFGIGSESLTIVQLSILTRWFSTSHSFPSLAVSMAMANCISSLGTVGAYDLIPVLGSKHVHKSLYILGFLPCILSLFTTFFLIFLEWYAKYIRKQEATGRPRYIVNGVIQKARGDGSQESETQASPLTCSEIWNGIKQFAPLYWYLVLFIVIFSGATQAFGNFATDLFVEKFSYSTVEAGRITSMPTWTAVATIVPAGMVIDYYGHRATLLIVGSVILIGSHIFIEFVPGTNKYL